VNNQDYWFPWFPAVFQANTLELSLEQDAIYRRLIDHYMITREPLPESHAALSRIVGCPIEIIEQNATAMLGAYFTHKNGMYFHKKCDEILDDQDARQKRKSISGKKAAKKRWSQVSENKEENATAMQQDRDRDKDSKKEVSKDTRHLDEFIAAYNQMAARSGLAQCMKLNDARKSKLKARIKDCGGWDGWMAALDKVEASSFLCGSTGWKAGIDFILTDESFTKIMEGNYDNAKRNGKNEKPTRADDLAQQARDFMGES
jgi:uncharacterized protein YdaU (DUF1376 family)